MKNPITDIKRKVLVTACASLITIISGCGQQQKLVLVTTESDYVTNVDLNDYYDMNSQNSNENSSNPYANNNYESSDLTLQQVYEANSGDVILSLSDGCSVSTVYYTNDVETYKEYQFLGFDKDGSYVQAYYDSDGNQKVLDSTNQCWYETKNGQVYTLLYPEEGFTEHYISFQHNNMILNDPSVSGDEKMKGVFHIDGTLVMETETMLNGDKVTYRYYLTDDLLVEEIYGLNAKGEIIMHATVEQNATYEIPKDIEAIMDDTEHLRTITVCYPDNPGLNSAFIVSSICPLNMEVFGTQVYGDANGVMKWSDIADSNGEYQDTVLYLK